MQPSARAVQARLPTFLVLSACLWVFSSFACWFLFSLVPWCLFDWPYRLWSSVSDRQSRMLHRWATETLTTSQVWSKTIRLIKKTKKTEKTTRTTTTKNTCPNRPLWNLKIRGMHQKRTPFKSLNGFQLLNIQILNDLESDFRIIKLFSSQSDTSLYLWEVFAEFARCRLWVPCERSLIAMGNS